MVARMVGFHLPRSSYVSDHDEGLVYSDEFYEDLGDLARHAATELVPLLMEQVEPKSVVDVGCGAGAFVHEFTRHGVNDVVGIEGPDFGAAHYRGPEESLLIRDLEEPLELDRRFDLVLCLEVAEHLPYARSAGFVRDLAALADVIVFSAAIPGQGGTHHVNEQWPTFWCDQFARHGLQAHDVLRPALWNNPSVATWYKQNVIVYARPGALPETFVAPQAPLMSVVHPDQYDLVRERMAELPSLEHNVRTLRHERDVAEHNFRRAEGERFRIELALKENVAELSRVTDDGRRIHEENQRLHSLLLAAQALAKRAPAGGAQRPPAPPAPPAEPQTTALPGVRRLLPGSLVSLLRRLVPGALTPTAPDAPLRSPAAEPFDAGWYVAGNPDVAALGVEPADHYRSTGWREHRSPHPLFDTVWYLATYPDVAALDVDPLYHFATTGWRERRNPHPLFDTEWYLGKNPDVVGLGLNPLAHFDTRGWQEGRSPHPLFDTTWYLTKNPDVAEVGMNPLTHFVLYGVYEGRAPAPPPTA